MAVSALALGMIVYLLDRDPQRVYLLRDYIRSPLITSPILGGIGAFLPTLTHVVAFILLSAAVLSTNKRGTLFICLGWFSLDVAAELAQHPSIAPYVIAAVPAWLSRMPVLANTADYFRRGTFDPRDVLSILGGTIAAWLFVTWMAQKGSSLVAKARSNHFMKYGRAWAGVAVIILGIATIIGSGGGGGTATPIPQDSSGDPENYFPTLTVGNTWLFRGTVLTNGTGTTPFSNKITITGTKVVQGAMTSIWHESNPLNYGTPVESYISKSLTGITYWGDNDPADTLTRQFTPYKEISFPLQVSTFEQINKTGLDYGEDLDGDGINETFDVYSQVRVISFQTFTAFVGTFDNTVEIETDSTITLYFSQINLELIFSGKETGWYAPHGGPVKRVDDLTNYDGTTETTTEEIVGYSVEGQKKGIVKEFAVTSNQANEPGRAALGFDGSNYFCVSCRDIGTSPGVFGVTVSSNGEPASTFSIAQFSPSAGCLSVSPAVAFDGSNYLVVFARDGQIYGTRVSPEGTVLDGTNGFVISTGIPNQITNWGPAVAYDGTNYLVVWGKFTADYDIYGARVTPGGQVLNEFVVFSAPGEQVFPSIAFDGTNYLVVWRDTRDGSGPSDSTDIYGTRVTPGAMVLDPAGIAISTAPKSQGDPRVIYDGTNYFAVWADQRLSGTYMNNDIFGARVSRDGVLLDGPSNTGGIAINTATYNNTYFDVAFDGQNYLVVWGTWNYSNNPPAGIFGAKVSKDGTLLYPSSSSDGIPLSGLPPDNIQYQYPSILFNGENMLLTYPGGPNINGMLIYP